MPLPLLLLAALLPAVPDVSVTTTKGASLLQGCQAELRLTASDALASPAEGDLVSGSYCIGYVNGFIANLPDDRASICTREQPMMALVQVYVRFMEQNPKLLGEDKRVGLRLALEDAFPCPSTAALSPRRMGLHRSRL